MSEKNDNIIFRTPAGVKEMFKEACDKANMGMSEVIRSFIAAFCEQYGVTSIKEKDEKHE